MSPKQVREHKSVKGSLVVEMLSGWRTVFPNSNDGVNENEGHSSVLNSELIYSGSNQGSYSEKGC